jgi:hypothetical protein
MEYMCMVVKILVTLWNYESVHQTNTLRKLIFIQIKSNKIMGQQS